ncbi:MAG: SGNH hydrolase domain-containing protein, partial [Geminicoccaceae bacterium]
PSPRRDPCHIDGPDFRDPTAACEYFSSNVKVAVFGDSHTAELAYAFAALLREYDIGIKQFSFSACPPSYRKRNGASGCSSWTDAVIDSIIHNNNIDAVILSYRIHDYLFGGHEDIYPELPMEGSATERRAIWDSYVDIMEELAEAGKKVVLVLQAPELPQEIENLIYQPVAASTSIAGVPRDWWAERTAYVQQHLGEIPAGVMIVDPADLFCDETNCYAAREDISYYFDDDHMSVAGASVVADAILSTFGLQEQLARSSAPSRRAGFEAMAVARPELIDAPVGAERPGR